MVRVARSVGVGVVRLVEAVGVVGEVEAAEGAELVEVVGVVRRQGDRTPSLRQIKQHVAAQGNPERPVRFS
jgi:hypothetical protein